MEQFAQDVGAVVLGALCGVTCVALATVVAVLADRFSSKISSFLNNEDGEDK